MTPFIYTVIGFGIILFIILIVKSKRFDKNNKRR